MLTLITPAFGEPQTSVVEAILTSLTSGAQGDSSDAVGRLSDFALSLALLDGLELEVAADRLWRICNRRVASGPGRFLAFVDEKQQQFEVTRVSDYFGRTPFPTLWDALVYVLEEYGDQLALQRVRHDYERAVEG
jgi:hypothetical protein